MQRNPNQTKNQNEISQLENSGEKKHVYSISNR
jgi:hypothetical protein